MDCGTPGLPVHHQLPEFTQTHVHWVSDAIQPSHPLSSPSSRPQSLRISKKYQITCNKNVCLYKQYLRKEKEVALLNRWKSSILLIIRNTKSKYAKILFFSYQNNRVPNVWIYWVGNGVVKKPLLVVREYIYVTSVEGSLVISVKFTNSHTLWPSTSMSTYTWIKWHVQCYL